MKQAIEKYTDNQKEIKEMLERLLREHKLCEENVNPEHIDWNDVGTSAHVASLLEEVMNFVFND